MWCDGVALAAVFCLSSCDELESPSGEHGLSSDPESTRTRWPAPSSFASETGEEQAGGGGESSRPSFARDAASSAGANSTRLDAGKGSVRNLDGGRDAAVQSREPEPGSDSLLSARCANRPFDEPLVVTGLEVEAELFAPSLSADRLTLFFAANREGEGEDILMATRTSEDASFGPARPIAGVNSPADDGTPSLSLSGLSLLFHTNRGGGLGDRDVGIATRTRLDGAFSDPQPLRGVNSTTLDHLATLSGDELTLLLVSTRSGGLGQSDLWVASRQSLEADFAAPVNVLAVNSPFDEGRGQLSADGLRLYLSSSRGGGQGEMDLWVAERSERTLEFERPQPLASLNSPRQDRDLQVSADGRYVVFSSNREGRNALWTATRSCD